MCSRVWFMSIAPIALCLAFVSCAVTDGGYEPLTHTASLRNVGKQDATDAVLFFGSGEFRMGIMPAGIAKHVSRTGQDIPEYASAEWRRADGSIHKGRIRVVKPKDMDKRERYVIQIDDDNSLSLEVEFPMVIPRSSE
jgi:hypothetical protein